MIFTSGGHNEIIVIPDVPINTLLICGVNYQNYEFEI